MRAPARADHRQVLVEEHAYVAHPHLVRVQDELLVVCNWVPRRPFVLHPPEDPLYLNLLLRSADDGQTWSAPEVAPAYGWNGVECAGLTHLGGGRLLLNQWRFDWLTLPAARARPDQTGLRSPGQLVAAHLASAEHEEGGLTMAAAERLLPWARGGGRAWVHRSDDGGRTWAESTEIATVPFEGGYGMRGGVTLADGAVLLPLGDVPDYRRVFVVRSEEGGASWSAAIAVAELADRWFEEPAPIVLRSGRVLMLLRENQSKSLWQTWSDDGGRSWAEPQPTGIDGYPAHLCQLEDGRVLCTYGFRRPPFGIRAALSTTDGLAWPERDRIEIRGDLPTKDLGYPCTVHCGQGLLSVYYARDRQGLTGIHATSWQL